MTVPLDPLICVNCPVGPVPMIRAVCNRCVADTQAIADRKVLADSLRHRLIYDGVNYADAILYMVLPNMLPSFDPALVQ